MLQLSGLENGALWFGTGIARCLWGKQLAVQEHLSRSGAREVVSLVPTWDSGLFPGLSPHRMLLGVLAVGEVSAEPGRPERRAGARGTGAEDQRAVLFLADQDRHFTDLGGEHPAPSGQSDRNAWRLCQSGPTRGVSGVVSFPCEIRGLVLDLSSSLRKC